MNILNSIKEKLQRSITDATFEGANIVLYTDNENFFREGESRIKENSNSTALEKQTNAVLAFHNSYPDILKKNF